MTVLSRLSLLLAMVFIAMTGGLSITDAQSPQEPPISTDTDRAALREELFQALKMARNEQEAQLAVARIWTFWMQGPDEEASRQIVEIFAARLAQDFDKALRIAEALVARLPDYAEGWNQKATVLYVQGKFDASLDAIERVLALEPKHFGALSGKAIILISQGRMALAQLVLCQAVDINPFLVERYLLIEPAGEPI
jgi:tetratricopeptide (TPR) repeat protein